MPEELPNLEPMLDGRPANVVAQMWRLRLDHYHRTFQKWQRSADKISSRYTKERDSERPDTDSAQGFNVLWSNIQTELPVVYGQAPKPDVRRSFGSKDDVGRVASQILENVLAQDNDLDDLDNAMRRSTLDFLLYGRGVPWVRHAPVIQQVTLPVTVNEMTGMVAGPEGQPIDQANVFQTADGSLAATVRFVMEESAPVDYVHWSDFAHAPLPTWEQVLRDGWAAKRVFLTQAEGVERFGEIFRKVPLKTNIPVVEQIKADQGTQTSAVPQEDQRGEVWEIWDQRTKRVYWIAKDFGQTPLDIRPDPLGLKDFFPCPKPAFGTVIDKSLIPVPDYEQWRDLHDDLEDLTIRISVLQQALVVKGIYDSSFENLGNLLQDSGTENQMFPVDNMAAYRDAAGTSQEILGPIRFFPVSMVATVYRELLTARQELKDQIFEITGLSDIMRGQVDPREALGQSRIKGNFGTLRISRKQREIARLARDTLRIKAEIIAEHFSDEHLQIMAGTDSMADADQALVPMAIAMLRQETARAFRVDVETDSTVSADDTQVRRERAEFIEAVGTMLRESLPAAQSQPELLPFIGEVIGFGVRAFKPGRAVEGALEQAIETLQLSAEAARNAPPPPDPVQMSIQLQQFIEEQRLANDRVRDENTAMNKRLELLLRGERLEFDREAKAAELQTQRDIAHDKLQAEAQQRAMNGPDAGPAIEDLTPPS